MRDFLSWGLSLLYLLGKASCGYTTTKSTACCAGDQRKEPDAADVKNVIGTSHIRKILVWRGPLTLGAMEEYALHGADGAIMIGPGVPQHLRGLIQMKNGLPR